MSPRLIDLKVVSEHLTYLQQILHDLRRLPAASFEEFETDWRNFPTAESLIRRAIECVIDIARHLLSRQFGLGSLEYRAAARAAAEHGLIRNEETAARFLEIAGFRKRLTHHYEAVTPTELYKIVSEHLGDLEAVAEDLRVAAEHLIAQESSPDAAP